MYLGVPAGYEDESEEDDFDYMTHSTKGLKITVVPDITTAAGLDGQDFDCKLSPELEKWLEEFKETYNKYKRSPINQHLVKQVLSRDPNPLELALKLYASCPDCNNFRNKNLSLFILESMCDLSKHQPGIRASCDDNTRMVAFNFVKTCATMPLCRSIKNTYQLEKIEQYLIPKLQELLANGLYKHVICWSITLNLTNIFGLFDLVLPLILQEKMVLLDDFLKYAKDLRLPTVQFLDSLLDHKRTVYENCEEILEKYKYTDVKHSVLSYRPMSKLVARLAKKYKIESEHTPNRLFSKSCSYLHYLFHKYQEGGMSFDSWRELAREETSQSKSLQLDLINKISSYGDLDEAMYWAELYEIPPEERPLVLQERLEKFDKNSMKNQVQSNSSNCSYESCYNSVTPTAMKNYTNFESANDDEYLTLQLPAESIVLVDDEEKVADMISYLEQHSLIGFDSEWKPSSSNDSSVSLIQLATIDRVYLVDCLSPNLTDSLWKLMGEKIFNNPEILKLGFSLQFDLEMLYKSSPLQLNVQATSSYLDLRDVWRRLKSMEISESPFEQISLAGESLCALTETCLGKKLDKLNQCSNWANRPLRYEQIIYAALDAHCLLQLYQIIAELFLRCGINIDTIVEDITTSNSGYLLTTKARKKSKLCTVLKKVTLQENENFEKIVASEPPSNSKFLCEEILSGVSKELRKLGLDCVNMIKTVDINNYIEIARKDYRYVLTRDSRYSLFLKALPEKQVLKMPKVSKNLQVIHILQSLQIQIDRRSLYSICMKCNGNDFLLANRYDMKAMRPSKNINTDIVIPPYHEDRARTLQRINDESIATKKTPNGKKIRVKILSPKIFNEEVHFFICNNCGTCSWPHSTVPVNRMILEYLYPNTSTGYETSNQNASQ